MSFEVEVKFREVDQVRLKAILLELGAIAEGTLDHEDAYLAHPSRDFSRTGEAFRIRSEGARNRVTYKGSKHEGPTKTREEIEVGFDEGPEAKGQVARMFALLGFQPVATVKKRRTSYALEFQGRAMTVTIDEFEGFGTFAEVEALAESESDLAQAQGAVLALAGSIGLVEVEPRSYLRMLLESEGRIARNLSGST